MLGLVALTIGAEGLVRGSASLAIRMGLTPLVIGLTVVAFGTSTPELVVSLIASLNHQPDISIGNVVGSNTFNIGIILGLTALLCPVKVNLQIIKHDGPIMIAVSLLALFLINRGTISRLTGVGLLIALVAYTSYSIWLVKKAVSAEIEQQFQEGVPSKSKSFYRDLWFIWRWAFTSYRRFSPSGGVGLRYRPSVWNKRGRHRSYDNSRWDEHARTGHFRCCGIAAPTRYCCGERCWVQYFQYSRNPGSRFHCQSTFGNRNNKFRFVDNGWIFYCFTSASVYGFKNTAVGRGIAALRIWRVSMGFMAFKLIPNHFNRRNKPIFIKAKPLCC